MGRRRLAAVLVLEEGAVVVKRVVPVVVVAGFLGAGKTTFLNAVLRNRRGLRVGAVVNDFGSVNVDALLVAGQADATVALTNGCVCCVVEDGDLGEAIGRLANPALGLDVIVVEASGLAEPSAVVRRVLGQPGSRTGYGGLVVVVDAVEVERQVAAGLDLRRHLGAAELVLVNKADLVGEEGVARVAAAARAANPRAPVAVAQFGQVDTGLLFDAARRPTDGPRQLTLDEALEEEGAQGERHPHWSFDSVTHQDSEPVDPRAFLDFLAGKPAGVYRVKGVVLFAGRGRGRKYVVNSVGPYVRFERLRWDLLEERRTSLVLVGAGMDRGAVVAALRGCRADGDVGPGAMAGVLRFTAGVGV